MADLKTKNPVFYLDIKIAEQNNLLNQRTLKLKAKFEYVPNTYGNGYYMAIMGREGCEYEKLFDIRYDAFNINNPEPFILNWAYNNWSGENGSWDIISLKIENSTVINKTKTMNKNALPGNVIK